MNAPIGYSEIDPDFAVTPESAGDDPCFGIPVDAHDIDPGFGVSDAALPIDTWDEGES